MAAHFIDLTDSRRDWDGEFVDDADKRAFGVNVQGRRLYKQQIWGLKQNDPNLRLLQLDSRQRPSNKQCARIGIYLCSSTYITKLLLVNSGLGPDAVEHLFGSIAMQNETNECVLKDDILGRSGVVEKSLVADIIESVTSFRNLVNVNISWNPVETDGLDTLTKALAGTPVEDLDISHCGINGIGPLRGTRKCTSLKKLYVAGNRVGIDDVEAVSILLDNGYPRLWHLGLQNCGFGDDLIEGISPVLSKNKCLKYFMIHNPSRSAALSNQIGARGIVALINAVHDSSSFEKTLASNHTIRKITVEGSHMGLYQACHPNLCAGFRAQKFGSLYIAWEKHINHVAASGDADMTPFMNIDVKLIPQLLVWIGHRNFPCRHLDYARSVYFQLWSCGMFRERIEMASRINNLQCSIDGLNAKVSLLEGATKRCVELEENNSKLAEENKRLREQMAKLVAQASESKPKTKVEVDAGVSSIAERVKARKNGRKRGRRA